MNISAMASTQSNSTMRAPESDDRNETVLAMLEEVRPMLWSFVLKYRLEFEEAYQHAAWLMLETWHKLPDDCTDVKAYLNATVRRGLYHMLKKNIDYDKLAFSLEMVRTEDGASIGDTLEASESGRTEAELDYVDRVTEVVHAVLRECRTEEQEYAQKTYELVNYTPVTNEKLAYRSRQVVQERDVRSIRRSVRGVFRKHPQAQGLIQRETAVL
jgi:hypothetical protein